MRAWSPGWERWYRRTLPAYVIFLFMSTHLPRLSFGTAAPKDSDKAVHLLAFGGLAFLFWRFAETFRRPLAGWFVWAALPVLAAYAAFDEYTQGFVEDRESDWWDWVADLTGIVAVLLFLELRRRWAARRPPPTSSRAGMESGRALP